MKGVCPECGFQGGLAAFTVEPEARQFEARLMGLPPPLHGPVLKYLALHRPRKRALSWGRALALLDELAADVERGAVRRKGRDWPAPVAAWAQACAVVVARRDEGKLETPLKGHGYLLEVLQGLADKAEAETERATEVRRQSGTRPAAVPENEASARARARAEVEQLIAQLERQREAAPAERRQAIQDNIDALRATLR